MPTYEYQCRECGHAFEEYQSITADALVLCPNCGKRTLKRVMGGGGGLIFKGSGFYQTDYKKNGSSPSTSSTDKKKTGATSTDKKGGETKPVESKSTESKPTSSESKDTGSSKKSD
jgi:putative FmdB family regulatory protein